MDRQSLIGFILIAIVFMVWMYFSMDQTPPPEEQEQQATEQTPEKDAEPQVTDQEFAPSAPVEEPDSVKYDRQFGRWFTHLTQKFEETFTVNTDAYTAVFTNRGGGIKRWTLNEFSTWNNDPLQLIDWKLPSDLNLFFGTADGKLIDSKDIFFEFRDIPGKSITLEDSSTFKFKAIAPVIGDSAMIIRTYTLRNGTYDFELDVEMRNMGAIIANNEYQVSIHSLALTEKNSVDEASFAEANAQVKGDRIGVDASDIEDIYKENLDGTTHWVSTHNKYFLNALISMSEDKTDGIYIEGARIPLPNEGVREVYQASMKIDYEGLPEESAKFQVFIGPMKYDLLKSQHEGLEQVLSLGLDWIIRPFSEYFIIPLFTFLHGFIPNYGVVIIIFSIILKILLYPLTKGQMESMAKMRALQPKMNELKEKYSDDQSKQSSEMMKLYSDYGINPAGGCLPLLLQMPILYALFTIFRSTFELRGEPFVWWINDLSSPDIILRLPFKLPFIGLEYFSGLALLMAVTMFLQQKQTIQDPRQKTMVYILPVVFWLLFNSFPSGLNLYYLIFNILSILQQRFLTKDSGEIELVKKTKKKGGSSWSQRMMQNLEQKAKEQQKARRK